MLLAEGTVNCLGQQSRGREAKYSIPWQIEQTTKLLGFGGGQREENNLVWEPKFSKKFQMYRKPLNLATDLVRKKTRLSFWKGKNGT